MGSSGGFRPNRGTTNVLSRTTGILAAALSRPACCCRSSPAPDLEPVLDPKIAVRRSPYRVARRPRRSASGSGGVLDALKQQGGGQPRPRRPQPSGPQVPR